MNLQDSVTLVPGVGEEMARKLKKLGITTVFDLLHHIPSRYVDYSKISNYNDITINEPVTVEGQIISLRNIYTKTGKVMQEGQISNGEHTLTVVWFNQTFLVRNLKIGTNIALTGKVSFWGKKRALFSPQYEIIHEGRDLLHSGRIVPIYPETAGLNSKWLRRLVFKALKENNFQEYINHDYLEKSDLNLLQDSLNKIHNPKSMADIESGRTRLAFNELLIHQLAQLERKKEWSKISPSKKFNIDQTDTDNFIKNLSFDLTPSQKRSIQEILNDLEENSPMNRLLEGDVGSGKTVVAAMAAFHALKNNSSAIVMAPTQLLAEQHAKTLTKIFDKHNIPVKLVTSKQKIKDLNERAVYVGTHALLYKLINDNVGLVVIDEQHRFGVKQRAEIAQKGTQTKTLPHVLTMTATPIPRTIALTLYGDLSISTLDELPSGRLPIKTWVVPPKKRDSAYEWIKREIGEHKTQAFIVCPLIDESEVETMKEVKNATVEFVKIKKIFKDKNVALLHGKIKRDEKTKILDDFRNKKIDILVTTPVVEVGIDIPNATIMVIESADRFGLAALHQLRGRVGRGAEQSYCLLFTDSKSDKVLTKLKAMSKTMSGRSLAELDLEMRGPGEIFGTRQSGLPELKIARWTDIDLIKKSRDFAVEVSNNPKKHEGVVKYFKLRQTAAN